MQRAVTGVLLGLLCSFAFASSTLTVAFNTNSYKYHYTSCRWAKKCTVNCIEITLKEAVDRGGIPCKVCKPPHSVVSHVDFSAAH